MLDLTVQEIHRVLAVDAIIQSRMTVPTAATMLGVNVRQVQRLVDGYKRAGLVAVVHGLKDQRGNHRIRSTERAKVIDLIRMQRKRTGLAWGPTAMHRYLESIGATGACRETIRQWMIEGYMHKPSPRRRARRRGESNQ